MEQLEENEQLNTSSDKNHGSRRNALLKKRDARMLERNVMISHEAAQGSH